MVELHLDFREMEGLLFSERVWPSQPAREAIAAYCGHPEDYLSRFTHLRCLDLRGLWGDMKSWRQCLVEAFILNPQLEHLELSLDHEARKRLEYECGDISTSLFSWTCEAYGTLPAKSNKATGEQSPIPLLRLRSLFLGEGFRFPDHHTLSRALALADMEVIYVYNDTYAGMEYTGQHGIYWIEWDVLSYQ